MNLNVEKILIIGVGMIGASIALASKSKGIKVAGFDNNPEFLNNAVKKQIIDEGIDSLEEINSKNHIKDIDLKIISPEMDNYKETPAKKNPSKNLGLFFL